MLTTGKNLFGSGAESSESTVPEDSENVVGTIVTNSSRQNVYSTGEWTSSGPWTTYYNNWQNANSRIQGFNMFMGDGYPDGTSQYTYMNDGESNAMTRVREYAHGNRVGNLRKGYYYYDNSTSGYGGITIRCLPVRNTTGATITRTFYAILSSKDNNYGGSGITVFTPNDDKGSWTTLDTYSSSSLVRQVGVNVTIPANTTVLIFATSCHYYNTTYRFQDTNMFYDLKNAIDNGLVCDLKMLETLATARIKEDTYTSNNAHRLYEIRDELFGAP